MIPGPSQTSKINIYMRTNNVFRLTLLKVHLTCSYASNLLNAPQPMSRQSSLTSLICKLYQNITTTLVFMIVLGIHCNFFTVLPIRLKTCRSNGFFFYKAQFARPKNRARLKGLARPRAPDRHRARNFFQACLFKPLLP